MLCLMKTTAQMMLGVAVALVNFCGGRGRVGGDIGKTPFQDAERKVAGK